MNRKTLDLQRCKCGAPACESPVLIQAACHPDSGLTTEYYNGTLTLGCAECANLVASIEVA